MTTGPAATALCALLAITGCGELLETSDRTQATAVAAGQAAEVAKGEDTAKCDADDVENDVVGGNSADPKNGGPGRRERCSSKEEPAGRNADDRP